jgi:hypothetical protein
MKLVPLSRGMFATVDDEDFEWASQFRWCASKGRGDSFYAVRQVWRLRKCGTLGNTTRQMQRDLLDPDWSLPPAVKADHWDGNTLNNQRHNLRLSSDSESNANRDGFSQAEHGFKGVDYVPKWRKRNPYVSRVRYQGRLYYGRPQADAKSAAREYNRLALKFFGEFARLNVIQDDVA